MITVSRATRRFRPSTLSCPFKGCKKLFKTRYGLSQHANTVHRHLPRIPPDSDQDHALRPEEVPAEDVDLVDDMRMESSSHGIDVNDAEMDLEDIEHGNEQPTSGARTTLHPSLTGMYHYQEWPNVAHKYSTQANHAIAKEISCREMHLHLHKPLGTLTTTHPSTTAFSSK